MSLLLSAGLVLLGWGLWNFGLLMYEKNQYDSRDEDWSFDKYKKKNWDNWIWSALFCVAMLAFGYLGLDLGKLHAEQIQWSDSYYLASGFISDKVANMIFGQKKSNT